MNVFVVINNDRHYDTDVSLFATLDAAITEARRIAELGARGHGYEESHIHGWAFHASYSPEGDSVWVVHKEIQ